MINLHFHKAEPVPFYVDTVFSLYRCSQCNKVLLVNRYTGYRKWMSKERALYQAYKSETGLYALFLIFYKKYIIIYIES